MNNIIADCDKIAIVDCDIKTCNTGSVHIKEDFAARLKEVIYEKYGKTNQTELAKRFGVKQATVSEWLNAIKMPGLEKLIEICIILNVSLDWLGTGRGDKKPIQSPEKSKILTDEQKKILKEIIDLDGD